MLELIERYILVDGVTVYLDYLEFVPGIPDSSTDLKERCHNIHLRVVLVLLTDDEGPADWIQYILPFETGRGVEVEEFGLFTGVSDAESFREFSEVRVFRLLADRADNQAFFWIQSCQSDYLGDPFDTVQEDVVILFAAMFHPRLAKPGHISQGILYPLRGNVDLGSIRPFDLVFRESLKFCQSVFPRYRSGRDKGFTFKEFGPFKELLGCPFPEVIGVEEDMSLVNEEEEVLIRVKPLRDQDIADEREGVVGCSDLYLVVCLEILDDCRFAVHFTMNPKDFRI